MLAAAAAALLSLLKLATEKFIFLWFSESLMIMEHVNRYLSFYVSCRYSMVWINWTRPLQFLFFHTDSDSRIRKKISSHCIVHTVQSRKWSEKCGIIADDKRPTPEVSNYSNCLWTRVCGIFSDNCQFPHSYVFQADRHRLSFAETTTTLPVGIPIHIY